MAAALEHRQIWTRKGLPKLLRPVHSRAGVAVGPMPSTMRCQECRKRPAREPVHSGDQTWWLCSRCAEKVRVEHAWNDVAKEWAKALDAQSYKAGVRTLRRQFREFAKRYPLQRGWLRASALQMESLLRQQEGKLEEAIRLVRERVRLPAYGHFGRLVDYLSLGGMLERLGRVDEAVKTLRQGIRFGLRHPDSTLVHLLDHLRRMGRLTGSKEMVQALQLSAKAITGRPWKPRPGEELAEIVEHYVRLDRKRNARRDQRLRGA